MKVRQAALPYDAMEQTLYQYAFISKQQSPKIIHRHVLAAWRYLDHPNVAKFFGIAYLEPGRPSGVVPVHVTS